MSGTTAEALAANQAFYDAFAAGDVQAMRQLWAEAAPVACAHPAAPLLVGRETVLESWAAILNATARPEIEARGAQAHLLNGAAFVTCYERLGGSGGAVLLATNIFAWEDGRWRMVHHHASQTPMAPPREAPHAPSGVLH